MQYSSERICEIQDLDDMKGIFGLLELYVASTNEVSTGEKHIFATPSTPNKRAYVVRKEMILLVSSTSTKRPTKLIANTAPTELMDHLPPPTEPRRVPRLQDRRLTI